MHQSSNSAQKLGKTAFASAAGWHIDKSTGYRFDVTEIDDWYAEINEAGDDQPANPWFDLELGIVVNQERVSLLPLLIDLIRQAPDDFNSRALAQRQDSDDAGSGAMR